MATAVKNWQVTLILDLDRSLDDDEFERLTADTANQAKIHRGTRKSEGAPALTVTTTARGVAATDAVAATVRGVESRLSRLPTRASKCLSMHVRNYLAAGLPTPAPA